MLLEPFQKQLRDIRPSRRTDGPHGKSRTQVFLADDAQPVFVNRPLKVEMLPPYEKVRKGEFRYERPISTEDAVNDRLVRKFDRLEKRELRKRRHVSIQAELRGFVKERRKRQRVGEKGGGRRNPHEEIGRIGHRTDRI
jgi:hypothetical protein